MLVRDEYARPSPATDIDDQIHQYDDEDDCDCVQGPAAIRSRDHPCRLAIDMLEQLVGLGQLGQPTPGFALISYSDILEHLAALEDCYALAQELRQQLEHGTFPAR